MISGTILLILAVCLLKPSFLAKEAEGGIAIPIGDVFEEPTMDAPEEPNTEEPTEEVEDDTPADDDPGEGEPEEEPEDEPDEGADAEPGDDSPVEIDDELRQRADGIFTDEELKAFAGSPAQLEAAINAVASKVLGSKDYSKMDPPAQQPADQPAAQPQPDPKPAADATPTEFKLEVNEEEFEDNPAQATAKMMQSVVEHMDRRISQIDGTVKQVGEAYQQQGNTVAQQNATRLMAETDRIRKELGSEFADLFGHQSIREVMMRPDSPEFHNNNALFTALNDWATYRGITDPAQWTVDLARQAMRGAGIPAFVEALDREPRKKLAKKLNGQAKGASPKPATRTKAKPKRSWDEEKAELTKQAQKAVGF